MLWKEIVIQFTFVHIYKLFKVDDTGNNSLVAFLESVRCKIAWWMALGHECRNSKQSFSLRKTTTSRSTYTITLSSKCSLFCNTFIAGIEKFLEITKFSSYYLGKLLGQRNCILCWHCNCNNEKSLLEKFDHYYYIDTLACTPRYYYTVYYLYLLLIS